MYIRKLLPTILSPALSRISDSPSMITLHRIWEWITFVRADDPVRSVLNRGFAHVISGIICIAVPLAIVTFISGRHMVEAIVIISSIPLHIIGWWLNRQGKTLGAALFAVICVVAIAVGLAPEEYAGLHPTIHVAFIFPVLAATLFIRPSAGLWACVLQMVALSIALARSNIPPAQVQLFLVTGTLHLSAITIFLIVSASIFLQALRASVASNTALRQLNAELEQRVDQRTADLLTANISLQEALANIKTLRGLLPICAACKKIRDDAGYWNQIESYIGKHSEAQFSHGICPECTTRLYPDLYAETDQERNS